MKKQMFRVLMLLVIMSSWKNQLKMKWRKRNDNSHRPWFRGPHHPKTLNRPWSPSPRRTGRGNNKRYACKVWYDYSVLHIFMFACMFPTYILAMSYTVRYRTVRYCTFTVRYRYGTVLYRTENLEIWNAANWILFRQGGTARSAAKSLNAAERR
jgi:hypothetical protein